MLILEKPTAQNREICVVSSSQNVISSNIETGLISTLSSVDEISLSYSVAERSTQEELYTKFANSISKYTFDFIYTLGAHATSVAQRAALDYRIDTPIFFGGVVDPVGKGFVFHNEFPGGNISGFSAVPRDYNEQFYALMELLGHCKKRIQHVIIPYNELTLPERVVPISDELIRYAFNKNIILRLMPFKHFDDLFNQIEQTLTDTSLIYMLRDGGTVDNSHKLIELCIKRKIPLFTSELESVKNGALFGYGDSEYNIGVQMAQRSLPCLVEHKSIGSLPVRDLNWKSKIMINRETVNRLNFPVDLSDEYFRNNPNIKIWPLAQNFQHEVATDRAAKNLG